MKLLFITQKVNRSDPVLGFVHAWLLEFSKHFSELLVVCLEEGNHELPGNVRVFSLGKEMSRGRFYYLFSFFKIVWREQKKYDAVFIHMNPVYAILGGVIWKILRKPMGLWYIHPKADPLLFLARPFIDFVATAVRGSFPLKWGKVKPVGHGIDTDFFMPDAALNREPHSLLAVGRIASIKRLELIQNALTRLRSAGVPFTIDFVGEKDPHELDYFKMVQDAYRSLVAEGRAHFRGALAKEAVRDAYNRRQILINFTPTGSFDKVVLEAMAMEMIPVTGNTAFKEAIPTGCFAEGDSNIQLFESLRYVLWLPEEVKKQYGQDSRKYVLENHNLKTLPLKIKSLYEGLLPTHAKV